MTENATPGSKRPVILCVDDEPSILSALRRLFRAHGFQVVAAESGQAGLDLLDTQPIDLVISDMRMPHMDGVVFLEHVRQRKPDVLRLLLTGYADIASITGAINRGSSADGIHAPLGSATRMVRMRPSPSMSRSCKPGARRASRHGHVRVLLRRNNGASARAHSTPSGFTRGTM